MKVVYSASEVLKVAQEMERNGQRFYLEAARAAAGRPVASFFHALAEDESRHLETYQEMARRVCESDCACQGEEEADAFLKALADSILFTPSEALQAGKFDEKKALEQAFRSEKDAVLYYLEILRFVEGADRVAVEKIIEEEKRHMRALHRRLAGED